MATVVNGGSSGARQQGRNVASELNQLDLAKFVTVF